MTTHDPLDYDEPMGENVPHIVNPDAWRARESAGANLDVIGDVLLWAVVIFWALWQMTGPK